MDDRGTLSRKLRLGILVPVAAAVVGLAAVAFACVPQGSIKLSPTSGAVGTSVTATGSNFTSGSAVSLWWGNPSQNRLLGTAVTKEDRTFAITFVVPATVNGQAIVAATQTDSSGTAIGSPANALFNVQTPGGATAATPSNLQTEPQNADGAAGLAPADDPAPAAVATPAPAPAAAPTPRVRLAPVAPAAPRAAAPAPAAAPAAPAAAAPAPEAAPAASPAPVAPAPAPAPEATPAPTPAKRSVMVTMSGDSGGSSALAIALVGVGLVLALGASALVLAGRRDSKAPARARR